MKKKLIFATMVLPALFAACTADEMVENSSANLQGRALLDPITVNVVGGNADTRFSWNEASYGWNGFTAEDKFSAGLVDDAAGTIQDKVMTNYVFSTADGSNYTTTSQMVEGAYLFYSYPGFETSAARAEVAFDLTSQVKVDLNNPAATVEENQLFVTPLYKLTKESANEKLNMEFVSYWSTAAIAVKNTSKQSFKLVRVLLSSTAADFAVKGKISPAAMKTAKLVYSYDKESGEYVLPEGISANDIRTADIAAGGATTQNSLFVDCQSYEVASGKSATVYIQVPAGVYKNTLTVEIVAEVTADGVTTLKSLKKDVVMNAKSNSSATENDAVRFSRGKTTALFGVVNGAPAAYELDDIELITAKGATGLYASSYEDVYGYLTDAELVKGNAAGTPLAIYNLGTLSLDDKLMTLLSRMKKHVEFINAIEIESESRTSATLDYAQFAAGAEITKGSIEIGGNVKLPASQNLTVDEEATATVGTGVTAANFAGTIVNNGTLNMAGTTATAITCGEDAVINVTGNQAWTSGYAMAKTINVSEKTTLTFNDDVVNAYGCTITNNGEIACGVKTPSPAANYKFTNNGTITNNGKITEVVNEATFKSATATTGRNAVIDNYGVIENVANDSDTNSAGAKATAIINMKSADAEIKAVTGDGEIDNTIGGFITSNTGNTVKAVYTGDQSGMLGNVMAVTKVEVTNGTWSKPAVPADLGELATDGVTMSNADGAISLKATTLNLKNSPSISAKGGVTLDATNIDLSGSTFGSDVTIATATAATLANVTFNGQLTADDLVSLALQGTVFNGAVSAADATTIAVDANTDANDKPVATTSTVNAKITADKVTALTVNNKATLEVTVNGEVGKVGSTVVTVSAGGTVTNKGIINGSKAAAVDSAGTWKGNAVKTA